MKQLLPFWIFTLVLVSCQSNSKSEVESSRNTERLEYKRWVGDIDFDASMDSESFVLCKDKFYTYQYFNDGNGMEYEGEKSAILSAFESNYDLNIKGQTGRVRIRFIVNCRGETGRYRVLGMDKNYQEKVFDSKITNELLRITKSLKGWRQKQVQGEDVDYYQYLVFKLKDGRIEEIMP